MLKIGDFSKLSYISIRMLRYYDESDLLKPAFIDPDTNYRFYNVKQLGIANTINKLRLLGFSNKDIKEILDKKDIDRHFNNKILELQDMIDKIKNTTKEIETLINDDFTKLEYNVVKKVIPKRKVVSLRKIVPSYMDENILWNQLFEEIKDKNIGITNNCMAIAIYHDLEYKDNNIDIEVQIDVTNDVVDSELIKVYTTDEVEVASVTFNGSYDKMADVTKSVLLWMQLNGYQLKQPTFNIFHISPAQDSDPNNWITEACFIIEKGLI